MHKLLICLLAICIGTAAMAQQKDSTKFDYKKANNDTKILRTTTSTTKTTTTDDSKSPAATTTAKTKKGSKTTQGKTTPAVHQKPMTAAEKKKAAEEEAEKEAATPKGVEAYFYSIPAEDLPVVQEFIAYKQTMSPHVKIVDDNVLRKQIIRFKDIDKGYMMLQKPGDSKYTKLQVFKKKNGNVIMAVEQGDCPNGVCSGTLKFYIKTGAGWKDTTDFYYPQIDHKFVISRLKSAYKKEYKDLAIYDSYGYEDNDAALKKAIVYQISPDDGYIVINEQNLPCKLYEMKWDDKKDKFDLVKIEKDPSPKK